MTKLLRTSFGACTATKSPYIFWLWEGSIWESSHCLYSWHAIQNSRFSSLNSDRKNPLNNSIPPEKKQRTNLNNFFSAIYISVKIMTFFRFFFFYQGAILIDLWRHIPLSLRRLSKDLLHFWTWSGVGRLNTEELWHSPPIAVSVFLRRRNWNFFFIFFALKRPKI